MAARRLPCPSLSAAVRVGANKSSCATSAEFGTRLLSDQLSDYRVDDPYIHAHLHGLSSRLVLALDDSPTVLRTKKSQVQILSPRPLLALSEPISIVALELVALSQVGPIQMGKGAARRAQAAVRHLQAAVSLSGTGSAVRPGQGAFRPGPGG
jgi:hypothetical protein